MLPSIQGWSDFDYAKCVELMRIRTMNDELRFCIVQINVCMRQHNGVLCDWSDAILLDFSLRRKIVFK